MIDKRMQDELDILQHDFLCHVLSAEEFAKRFCKIHTECHIRTIEELFPIRIPGGEIDQNIEYLKKQLLDF